LNYLTSNVNSYFIAKSQFIRSSEGIKEKLPIKNEEESSLVAESGEISNLFLIRDMAAINQLENVLPSLK